MTVYYVIVSVLFAFIVGACLGSARLCQLDRKKRKEAWGNGRSHCTSCNHELHTKDLIPLVSYMRLGGKCRYCGAHIPMVAPFSELVMGAAFAFAASSAIISIHAGNIPYAIATALTFIISAYGAVDDMSTHETSYFVMFSIPAIGILYLALFGPRVRILVVIAWFLIMKVLNLMAQKIKHVPYGIGDADICVFCGLLALRSVFAMSVLFPVMAVECCLMFPLVKKIQKAQNTEEESQAIGMLPFVIFAAFIADIIATLAPSYLTLI